MPRRCPSDVRHYASQGWVRQFLTDANAQCQFFDLFGFLQGDARTEFYALREEIVGCLALVEALIDFGEGEDIEEGVFEEGPFCPSLFSGREGFLTRYAQQGDERSV
jgi:hypothetical protein